MRIRISLFFYNRYDLKKTNLNGGKGTMYIKTYIITYIKNCKRGKIVLFLKGVFGIVLEYLE